MKRLSLNDTQRENVLEMCRKLLPHMKNIFFVGYNLDIVYIGEDINESIHWFEFILTVLSRALIRYSIQNNTIRPDINNLYRKAFEGIHPVDCIYSEFKKMGL